MDSDKEIVPPDNYVIGQEFNWDAPWVDVQLWAELPFWLMVGNTTVTIEFEGHEFQVALHDNYFELCAGEVTESRVSVIYRGPMKKREHLSERVREILDKNPNVPFMWRKCKTVVKIASRCNGDVWAAAMGEKKIHRPPVELYLQELCRAHIPVLNRLIQGYRLATYDYFAFEVAPWDVPFWMIDRGGRAANAILVPYRGWDRKPVFFEGFSFKPPVGPKGPPKVHQLISADDLRKEISSTSATPGELELLDALNLMERGDYSGAVRRITTAIEVIVEAVVGREVEAIDGKAQAEKFLESTRMKFDRRVSKYEAMSKRTLPDALRRQLSGTRKLRHRIVHGGYRIGSGERGAAQKAVDIGRWTFNWFENDKIRQTLRETNLGRRSIGRDMSYGVFPSKITPQGVLLTAIKLPKETSSKP